MFGSSLFLVLLLGASSPSGAHAAQAARQELDVIAHRIQVLKLRRIHGQDVGRELQHLLVRAQELAFVIERAEGAVAPPAATAPSPEELRERADALRDQADRLVAALATLDLRIADARREADGRYPRAAAATAPPGDAAMRARRLLADRAAVVERLKVVRAEASRLEDEAVLLEHDP